MPQLDPANYSTQLFWLTISFVLLYVVLARFLLPRIQHIFDLRTRTIENDIGQAESLESEAKRVQDAYEKAHADAKAQSEAVVSEMKQKINDMAAKRQAEMDALVEAQLTQSEEAIVRAKRDVMGKLKPVAVEIAEKIVEIVANYKPSSKELESAVGANAKENVL